MLQTTARCPFPTHRLSNPIRYRPRIPLTSNGRLSRTSGTDRDSTRAVGKVETAHGNGIRTSHWGNIPKKHIHVRGAAPQKLLPQNHSRHERRPLMLSGVKRTFPHSLAD